MIRRATLIALVALAACRDETVTLPGGLQVEHLETLVEAQAAEDEVWIVVRVVAPALGTDDIVPETMAAGTDAICAEWGVPAALNMTDPPDQIVVSVMSREVERGRPTPDVTQVFAGYRFESGLCIWEDF